MHTPYAQDFAQFLKHTNEKPVLLDRIKHLLGERAQLSTVLDIGAGDGLLAKPLAQLVGSYTAIEKNPDHVAQLRAAALETIESTFPCPIPGHYDLVLLSHVVSFRTNNWTDILPPAIKALAPKGKLVIITYRSSDDDWNQLRTTIGMPADTSPFSERFDDMVTFLQTQGTVQIETITTTVDTDTVDDMIASLAFVASNGLPETKSQFLAQTQTLTTLLETRYKKAGHYSFPFQHTMIVLM